MRAYLLLLALIQLCFSRASLAAEVIYSAEGVSWERSGHNNASDKFSPLEQINRTNVKSLREAWTYHSQDETSVQSNPIYSDGFLYTTSSCCVIALNAVNGNEIWRAKIPQPVARRGMTYSHGNLFVPSANGIHVIDGRSGQVNYKFGSKGIFGFGSNGVFGTETSYLPPIISGNKIIIANFLSSIESWDMESGRLLWKLSLQKDGIYPRLWSGLSYDRDNDLIFVVTSNRGGLFTKGLGYDHDFASSLLGIDGRTGKVVWQFQELRREIWDLDMVGPPIVFDLHLTNNVVPAVVGLSKTGQVILVNRKTGQPIFDIRRIKAPNFDVSGEVASEEQIIIDKPERFSDVVFDMTRDVTNLSDRKRSYVLHKLRNSQSERYLPVSLNHDVVLFGLNGGAEWPGGAVDPESGTLYVPSNNYPFILRANYTDKRPKFSKRLASQNQIYMSKCSICHGDDLSGFIDLGIGDRYNPALIGITLKREKGRLTSLKQFFTDHEYSRINNPAEASDQLKDISESNLNDLYSLFKAIDDDIVKREDLSYIGTYQYLFDQDGQFGSAPPWGYLSAIDLSTGKIKWKTPFGEVYDKETDKQYKGDVNFGGVIATGGALVFANGTRDSKARAFDVANGEVLWETKLPATGSSPPTTYFIDGCQYVVFTATGGDRFGNHSDATVAYRLADCGAERR